MQPKQPFFSQHNASYNITLLELCYMMHGFVLVMYESSGQRWGIDSHWQRQKGSYPSLCPGQGQNTRWQGSPTNTWCFIDCWGKIIVLLRPVLQGSQGQTPVEVELIQFAATGSMLESSGSEHSWLADTWDWLCSSSMNTVCRPVPGVTSSLSVYTGSISASF